MSPPHPSRRRRRVHTPCSFVLLALLAISPIHAAAVADGTPFNLGSLDMANYARLAAVFVDKPARYEPLQMKNPHSAPLSGLRSDALIDVDTGSGSGGGQSGGLVPQLGQAVSGLASSPQEAQKAKTADASKLDLQTFGGALGGIRAPAITMSDTKARPFRVTDDMFDDFESAAMKSCDVQRGRCNLAAIRDNSAPGPNGGKGGKPQRGGSSPKAAFSAGDCDAQKNQCEAAQKSAQIQTFNLENLGPDPAEPEFELFCVP